MEDFERLDIVALKHLYLKKAKELSSKLLQGEDWRQVEEQKREVTALSIELDKRLNRNTGSGHPAEIPFRGG
jgi:hypothetical protein